MPKRGYFVWADGDHGCGYAVVAMSTREAKKIAFNAELCFHYDWTEIRCRWTRHAAVDDLPIGMVKDTRDALIRGLYETIVEYPCDVCCGDTQVKCYNGRVMCDWCIERARANE